MVAGPRSRSRRAASPLVRPCDEDARSATNVSTGTFQNGARTDEGVRTAF
jgi:hypothetical protein